MIVAVVAALPVTMGGSGPSGPIGVTVYLVTGAPPSSRGALQLTVAFPVSGRGSHARRGTGGGGRDTLALSPAGDVPARLVAVTAKR